VYKNATACEIVKAFKAMTAGASTTLPARCVGTLTAKSPSPQNDADQGVDTENVFD
jgi:hypothetical protein